MATDLYAILGVSRTATPAEISHAYRLLVRRHHPDSRPPDQASPGPDREVTDTSAPGHDAALQDVVDAYQVLHDPVQRAQYDKRLEPPVNTKTPPRQPRAPRPRFPQSGGPSIIAGPVYWEPPRRR